MTIILFALVAFYAWNWLMTWGLFEVGIGRAQEYTVFAAVEFIFTLVGLFIMVLTGHFANQKSYYKDFLEGKKAELKARRDEEQLKERQ